MRRIRLLIYECASLEMMDKQLASSIQGTKVMNRPDGSYRNDRPAMTIQAIDIDLRRVTLLEVWQMVKMEW